MDPTVFVVVLFGFYILIYFLNELFKSCMLYPYDIFLKNTGLTIQFLRIRWHTTALNRAVLRWGNTGSASRSFLMKTYTIGVIVAMLLIPVGIILLFMTIFSSGDSHGEKLAKLENYSKKAAPTTAVTPSMKIEILLPGVNLPLEEIGFYICTLLISTIIHELGHAMAAVLEDIPVTGFGFQVYFCIPLAFTEISQDHLSSLKWFRKLRIICGGIWHNFLFAVICLILFFSLNFMTSPLYNLNQGVIVTEITEKSPLRTKDDRGIFPGNIITQVNDCQIKNEDDYYGCLLRALKLKPSYCVSSDFIRLNDESIEIPHHGPDGTLQCCDQKNEKVCCFENIADLINNDEPVEIPQHMCLDVRKTIENAFRTCLSGNCDEGFCLRPLLRNTTTIFNIKRHMNMNESRKLKNVIYIGQPADLTRTIRVSPFIPKQNYISAEWGDSYALFLKYNIVFSIGLALMNAIPCFGFDGYHITNTIINSFLVNRVTERPKRDVIALIITAIGTLFFTIAVLKLVWLSILRYLI